MPRKYPPKSIPVRVFVLKVTLKGSKPSIWRRLHVLDNMELGDLHYAIQIAMGWQNCHLHEFILGKRHISTIYPELEDDLYPMEDEDQFMLRDILTRSRQKILYVYDFGDGWQHDLLLEEIAAPDREVKYPVCTDGKSACPPDDCGGIGGFYDMLEALEDSKHPEYKNYRNWLGGSFDVDEFALDAVNEELNNIGKWRKWAEH